MTTLLFIEASNDIDEKEYEHIKTVAELYEIAVIKTTAGTVDELRNKLKGIQKVEYLYLATHACTTWFGSDDGKLYMQWEDFAVAICSAQCLARESKILLGCCRGGHRRVASTLFAYCSDIDYVFGPRWTVMAGDLVLGFHCVLYNTVIRREQPNVSVERASSATGYDFYGYDRAEIEDEWERSGFPYHLQITEGYVEYMPVSIIQQLIRNYRRNVVESRLTEDEETSLNVLEEEERKRIEASSQRPASAA